MARPPVSNHDMTQEARLMAQEGLGVLTYDPQRIERQFSFNPFKFSNKASKSGSKALASPQSRSAQTLWAFWGRFFYVVGFILKLWYLTWQEGQIWTYLGEEDIERAQSKRRRANARWLTEMFLKLGPTFIKVGQSISTRVDLIRKEYIDELSKLQDRVPALPFSEIKAIIETELDASLAEVFEWVEETPLAAASLGQVHRARVNVSSIQEPGLDAPALVIPDLVIKVQRPNLQDTFEVDLAILRKVARFFQANTELGRGREWVQIVDEFGKTLYEEIDYIQEGRHADVFRENFRDNPDVHIPVVFWEWTSRRLIAYEYAPGIKINDIRQLELKGLDRPHLAQAVVQCFFQQILLDGYYHADPHPGNLAVREDGVIIIYDYGMVGQLTEKTRLTIVEAFLNIINKKPDHILNNLLDLDMISANADLDVIRQLIEWALDNYYDVPHEQLNFEYLTDELSELMYAHPFKLPANFTFMIRSLITLEGVATHLHPGIEFMAVAVDYARRYIGETMGLGFILKKGKELLSGVGLGNAAATRKTPQRVRLQQDEWMPLGRYVKGAATLLAIGQLLQGSAILCWLWYSDTVRLYVLLLLTALLVGYGIFMLAILVMFPAYRKPVRLSLSSTNSSHKN